MPSYYLHRDGQNHGPYPEDQMRELIASNQVTADEQICVEGGSDWVAASTLSEPPAPTLLTGTAPPSITQRPASNILAVTQEQVSAAYQKIKTPFLGVVFSIGVPMILWAARNDAARGVETRGKHRALKELAKENTDLLPIAAVLGIIGATICGFWLANTWKKAKALKTQFKLQ